MATTPLGLYNLTAPVVMAHPNLFEARAFGPKGKESGTPKFSATLVIPGDHPDAGPIKNLAIKLAKEQWPGRDLKELQMPFSSGTKAADKRAAERKAAGKEPDGEYQRGCMILPARSKYEPKLSALMNGGIVDFHDESARKANKDKFFFGAEVLAQINLAPYKGVGKNPDGVCAYLNMVLATGKGKKLSGGGGQSAAEAFKGYVGQATNEDPVGESDDGGQSGVPEQW